MGGYQTRAGILAPNSRVLASENKDRNTLQYNMRVFKWLYWQVLVYMTNKKVHKRDAWIGFFDFQKVLRKRGFVNLWLLDLCETVISNIRQWTIT